MIIPLERKCKYEIIEEKKEPNIHITKRTLCRKPLLRRVFLEIVKMEPCVAGDIRDIIFEPSRRQFFSILKTLISMNLIGRIPVTECEKKKTFMHKRAWEKFNIWSENMSNKTRDYYYARTGYYYITDFGESFIEWACKFEKIKLIQKGDQNS